MAKKEYAPGIPDSTRFEPIPSVTKPSKWDSVIHRHAAFKAGLHFDFRLHEPGTENLHSWALRKLPGPGEKALAIQQPTHSADYKTFEGVIPKGYGAGAVGIESNKKVEILNASPDKITFQMGKDLFTMVKTKGYKERAWLLINRTVPMPKKAGAAGADDILPLLFTNLLKGTRLSKTVWGKKG
jgi:hypothetical protein